MLLSKYTFPFILLAFVFVSCGGSDDNAPNPISSQPTIPSTYIFNGVTDRTSVIIYTKSETNAINEIPMDMTNISENAIFNEYLFYYRDTIIVETDSTVAFRHLDNSIKIMLDEDNAAVPFTYDLEGFHFTIQEGADEIVIDGLGNLDGFNIPYDYIVIHSADNTMTSSKNYGSSSISQDPFDIMQPGDTMALMQFNRSFIRE